MRNLIFIGILLLVINGTMAQKETNLSCEVRPIASSVSIDGHQLYYALPKNMIRISIDILQTTQTPGPYAKYAEKFLNITEGIVIEESSYFEMVGAEFTRYSRPDSLKMFELSYMGTGNFPKFQLAANGIILGCNLPSEVFYENNIPSEYFFMEDKPDPSVFYDLGVKPFVEEKTETLYKIVQTDSMAKKVPYDNTRMQPTTEENNANEAASFIRKIRKRRLKLLIGLKDETFPVDGQAMQIMVSELKQLEDNYLELFVGKSVKKKFTYTIDFEPDGDIQAEQKIIAWFSQTNGLSSSKPELRKTDYRPITIFANTIGKVPDVSIQKMDNSSKSPAPIKHGLYYRIPAMVNVSLAYIDRVLYKQKMLIAQKGAILALPAEYINQSEYGIEFYPDFGSIKRISRNTDE